MSYFRVSSGEGEHDDKRGRDHASWTYVQYQGVHRRGRVMYRLSRRVQPDEKKEYILRGANLTSARYPRY